MFTQDRRLKKTMLATMLAVFPLFTACGGGGGDDSSDDSDDGINLLGCLVGALAGAPNNQYCGSSGSSSGSGSSGGTTSPPPPSSDDGIIRILGQNEIEPNNDLINADPVAFSSSTESKVGFTVDGSVNDTDDVEDYFTFVRPRARTLRFQLCPPGVMICENSSQIDTLTAYIDVLDQDGNVLASSQAASANVFVLPVSAGISYYVRVAAGDTMATTVGYKLTVYETN